MPRADCGPENAPGAAQQGGDPAPARRARPSCLPGHGRDGAAGRASTLRGADRVRTGRGDDVGSHGGGLRHGPPAPGPVLPPLGLPEWEAFVSGLPGARWRTEPPAVGRHQRPPGRLARRGRRRVRRRRLDAGPSQQPEGGLQVLPRPRPPPRLRARPCLAPGARRPAARSRVREAEQHAGEAAPRPPLVAASDGGGAPVVLGAATQDTGIRFSREQKTYTHEIHPQIDLERNKIVDDLAFAGRIAARAMVERPDAPRADRNAAGDRFETDGRIAVLLLR